MGVPNNNWDNMPQEYYLYIIYCKACDEIGERVIRFLLNVAASEDEYRTEGGSWQS